MNDANQGGGRLQQVVGHWLARIQVAGISHGDAVRVIADWMAERLGGRVAP